MQKQFLWSVLFSVSVLAGAAVIHAFTVAKPTPATKNAMPMCHSVDDFAAFANDPAFLAAHPSPKPITVDHQGKMVDFPVEGGPNGRGYLMMSHAKTNKYLLLFHEWWGLNDYIKNETAMWCHDLGINVLALDLYDGKVATTPEEAGNLMKANDPARSAAIIQGAMKVLGENADYRTMGWCFGGGWSMQAALLLKDKAKGCVMYYGMPEKDLEKLKSLSTDVLFIHASQDQWINDQVVADLEKNMKEAGKTVTVQRYDANHAFANPSSPRYNEASAKASRAVVKAYLMGK
ncbi:MAG: dienelactone hydrolase family protein [Chitinophagales bacterium]|nr:dienelactone hydrolase family protein [Chitinophagales bacterium]